MAVIPPTKKGKTYSIWRILVPFILFPHSSTIHPLFEPGLRLNTITSCWSMIEAFTRNCLDEIVLTKYHEIPLPKDYQHKFSFLDKLLNLFRSKAKIEDLRLRSELNLKVKLSDKITDVSWSQLGTIAETVGFPLNSISNESWAFTKHLYNLRNAFLHGRKIKILKSNFESHPDEITERYNKALRYFESKKAISLQRLIDTQDINELLNKSLTDVVIDETVKALDELAELFKNTYESAQYKKLRTNA